MTDGYDSEGCYYDRELVPEPDPFHGTPVHTPDWLAIAETDFLRTAQELKPWFHRLISWLGRN